MRFLKLLLLFSFAAVVAVPAWAGTETATIDVSATVSGGCKIISSTNLSFGTYNPANQHFSSALDATGSITFRCVKGLWPVVTLDLGGWPPAGATCETPLRQMIGADSGEFLPYNVFQDSARTTVWGCAGTNDYLTVSDSIYSPLTLTLYGRIPAAQNVYAEDFSDSLLLTVAF